MYGNLIWDCLKWEHFFIFVFWIIAIDFLKCIYGVEFQKIKTILIRKKLSFLNCMQLDLFWKRTIYVNHNLPWNLILCVFRTFASVFLYFSLLYIFSVIYCSENITLHSKIKVFESRYHQVLSYFSKVYLLHFNFQNWRGVQFNIYIYLLKMQDVQLLHKWHYVQ